MVRRVRHAGGALAVAAVLAAVLAVGGLLGWVGWWHGPNAVEVGSGPVEPGPGHADEAPGAPAAGGQAGAPAPGPAAGANPAEETRWVESTLAELSLEQRVGQMIMGVVFGTSGTDRNPAAVAANRRTSGVDTAAEAVATLGLGGVIYFDAGGAGPGALPDNIIDPAQVTALSGDLRAAARVPLLIGTDQEQGAVLRIRDGVTLLPGQMAQAATGRVADARDAARITGADLRALGINVDFAPDADVNSDPANPVIGERSFGDDPAAVGRFTAAAVEGYRQAGVAAAAKHFPGHGATSVDSHVELPTIDRDRASLAALDLPPFQAAIAAGVPMIMVGHLSVPALDPNAPATLSKAVVDGLLRHELGFDGVVVTDALNMAAITRHNTGGAAAVRAVRAGVDLLLMPPDVVEARDAVVAAVRAGSITPDRLDDSVRRLLRMKWRLGHGAAATPDSHEATEPPEITAESIARRAVTLLDQPTCGLLPLLRGGMPGGDGAAGGGAGGGDGGGGAGGAVAEVELSGPSSAVRMLLAALGERGTAAKVVPAGAAPGPPVAPTGSQAGAADGTPAPIRVVLVGNSPPPMADRRTVVVSTGTPYQPPVGAGAWLATYSRDPASMKALAAVLTGAADPAGRLPVTTRTATGTPLPRGSGQPKPRPC
ncbi:beta-N-acetylhexosaminidase [Frankia sp. EI5c]|uniref:glycoside hydrolase family 3 protein n=1 Tax=Frankia sp. EI5c TaxID=683316 RepID=UPI0007C2A8D8|nr:glycoside hydrolase family 3 protein [Frankia sp. EI5c]OAA28815.1 beta-N-acetylhexosaminidase [Frankia sp. EI5c]